MVATTEHHPNKRDEMRKARLIILVGLAVWLVLAVLLQVRYGVLATFVLAGWGGSMVMCLGMTVGPLASHQLRDREPKPRPIGAGNSHNGTSPHRSAGGAVRRVA